MHPYQLMVKRFHEKFGLTLNLVPTIPSPKDVILRINLIMEESGELLEAASWSLLDFEPQGISKSIIGVADACADLLYVIYGAANTYGLILSLDFQKIDSFGYEDPVYLAEFPETKLPKMNRQVMDLNRRFVECSFNQDLGKIWLTLNDMTAHTFAVAKACGIHIDPVFREVQRSNMSKVWPDGSVKRRETDGKILKPPTYSPADIAGVLKLQIEAA